MKKTASLLFVFFLTAMAWSQSPALAGEYHLVSKKNIQEDVRFPRILSIREDNTAIVLYTLRTAGIDAYGKEVLRWRLEKDILFLNDVGYYISWSKNQWDNWVLCLTPAFDSKDKVFGVKEDGK